MTYNLSISIPNATRTREMIVETAKVAAMALYYFICFTIAVSLMVEAPIIGLLFILLFLL